MWKNGFLYAAAAIAAVMGVACDDSGPASEWSPDAAVPVDRQWMFVSERDGSAVSVFDFDTLEPWGRIPVGSDPVEVIASPDGTTVWTPCQGSNEVFVLDAATLTIRHRVGVGARPTHSYLSPDRRTLWVGNDGSADVSVIDLITGDEERILTGNGHHKMALVPDGQGDLSQVWVSNISDATLTVVDAQTRQAITNVPVGPAPHGMDYEASTTRVHNCSGDEQGSVEVLDTVGDEARTVVSRIPLPDRCGYLHEKGGQVFATVRSEDLLVRIDPATEDVDTFDTGADYPDKFLIRDGVAFVAHVLEPAVTVIDLGSGTKMATIPVGEAHVEDGRGHRSIRGFEDRVLVPNQEDGTVTVIDATTFEVVGTLEGMTGPFDVAVAGPRGGTTYPR